MTLPADSASTRRYARQLAALMATTRDVLDDEQYADVLPALTRLSELLPDSTRPATPTLRMA